MTLTGDKKSKVNKFEALSVFLVPRLTTAERDGIFALNGMIIYNLTTNKFQGREDGAWVNLI